MHLTLYLAGNALAVQGERQDVIAGNLANVSSTGYKRLRPAIRAAALDTSAFPAQVEAALEELILSAATDSSAGELRPTGNPAHLALSGSGYFVVSDGGGKAYTRDGSFQLDATSTLVDRAGRPVLGERGPVQITGSEWSVSADGTVMVEGAPVDRLLIVDFPADLAVRAGDGLLHAPPSATKPAATPQVRAGRLESSNVRPMEEMVQMIAGMRTFEALQRLIMAHDQMLERAVNEVGRT